MTNKNSTSSAAEKTKTAEATWPDFAAGLFDKLSGRGTKIAYEFNDMNVFIPAKLGDSSDHYHWKFSGALNISTGDEVNDENDENGE